MRPLIALCLAAGGLAAAFPIRPDAALTPGAVATRDPGVVCSPGYARRARHVAPGVRRAVFAAYGIDPRAGRFELDHLVSLELGGSNDARNLWPESYDTRPWNAHVKDRLENRLHRLVCDGSLSLPDAQARIAGDWIATAERY
jgi:hypothetical protein